MARWSIDDIDWSAFDPSQVDMDSVVLAKTASLVEYNSADYTHYLSNVFANDDEFKAVAREWGDEERLHGIVLAKWAALADPAFDFEASLGRFKKHFQVPLQSTESVRGSKASELVARCVVESGTTSYYTALAERSREPVFRQICQQIARDEIHHYNLFYAYLKKYLPEEKMNRFQRLKVALLRSVEVSDEELAFAYAASNIEGEIRPELCRDYSDQYLRRGYGVYRRKHLDRAIALLMKAAGFEPRQGFSRLMAWVAWLWMQGQSLVIKWRRLRQESRPRVVSLEWAQEPR